MPRGLSIAQRITAIADTAGLELAGIQDHPYNAEFADTLTLITWLASRPAGFTSFPTWPTCRCAPPAMLTKQAATIDVLSGGRGAASRDR